MALFQNTFQCMTFPEHIPAQASSSAHGDPIKEFVECLYVNYDFGLVQQKLLECEKVRERE